MGIYLYNTPPRNQWFPLNHRWLTPLLAIMGFNSITFYFYGFLRFISQDHRLQYYSSSILVKTDQDTGN